MFSVRPATFIIGAFLAAGAAPADAAPRDDAAAAIARCWVYGDNRAYLDCVYGAVQPLRSSLGLPSASPAQLRLVPPAMSPQVPPQPAAPLNAGTSPTPPGNGVLGQFFGSAADLHMTAYSFDKRGLFTVTLSNGQIWRQVATDTAYAQFGAKPADYVVSLSAAEPGFAKMTVRGETGVFTVQQIR